MDGKKQNGNLMKHDSERDFHQRLATGLGWFSVGLGLAEVVSPGFVANLIGIPDEGRTRGLLRFYGLREVAAGVGILSQPQPANWLWGRVAGDVLDLATLGSAMSSDDANKTRTGAAAAAVLAVTALDVLCAIELSRSSSPPAKADKGSSKATKVITVNRTPEEVYRFWRDFGNLPTFMKHLESVQVSDDKRSHWKAKGPAGTTFEWDAEIVEDQPDALIAWRSLEGSEIDNSGSIQFQRASGGRGTVLRVDLRYSPPGGAIGANVAKLFGEEPGQQIDDDLRLFKQIMETGEVVKSDASIHSGMHPAQPAAV